MMAAQISMYETKINCTMCEEYARKLIIPYHGELTIDVEIQMEEVVRRHKALCQKCRERYAITKYEVSYHDFKRIAFQWYLIGFSIGCSLAAIGITLVKFFKN